MPRRGNSLPPASGGTTPALPTGPGTRTRGRPRPSAADDVACAGDPGRAFGAILAESLRPGPDGFFDPRRQRLHRPRDPTSPGSALQRDRRPPVSPGTRRAPLVRRRADRAGMEPSLGESTGSPGGRESRDAMFERLPQGAFGRSHDSPDVWSFFGAMIRPIAPDWI